MIEQTNIQLAHTVLVRCLEKKIKLAVAESCTGGLLSATLTQVQGISAVFWGGCVSYSNEAKMKLLGVPAHMIENYGAVSIEVAQMMAEGALRIFQVDVAVAISGIAGPTGGSFEKPVGTVAIVAAHKNGTVLPTWHRFLGGRNDIQNQSVQHALLLVLKIAIM